jgi:hypothetical protein
LINHLSYLYNLIMAKVKGEHLFAQHAEVVTPWNKVSKSQTVRATLTAADLQLGDAVGTPQITLATAEVVNRSGSIEVTGGKGQKQVVITAVVRGGSQEAIDRRLGRLDKRLRIGEVDGDLVVIERKRALGLVGGPLYPDVEVKVSAPDKSAVRYQLTTVDAPVTARGVTFAGGSKMESHSGDTTAEEAKGDVHLKSSSGKARLVKYTGDATVDIGNGEFTGVDVSGHTTLLGNNVRAHYWHGDGELTVSTNTGATVIDGYLPPEEGHEQPVPTKDSKRLTVNVTSTGKGPVRIEHAEATLHIDSSGPVTVKESLVSDSTVRGGGASVVFEQVGFTGTNYVKNTGNGGISVVLGDEIPLHISATTIGGKAEIGPGFELIRPEPGVLVTDHFVADKGTQKGKRNELLIGADKGTVVVAQRRIAA